MPAVNLGLLAQRTRQRNPLLWQADIPAHILESLDPTLRGSLEALQNDAPAHIREGLGAVSGGRTALDQAQIIASNWGNYDLDPSLRVQWMADVNAYGPVEAGNRWESVFTNARRNSDGSPFRNWIALPGRSNHQRGAAADLSYGSDEVREYVHQQAQNYDLNFPLGNEPWHIEHASTRGGTSEGGLPGASAASAAGRPAQGLLGQGTAGMGRGGQQQEQQPFGQRLRDNFRSGGSGWDTLALGLNGMTLRPDPGMQGLAGGRIADRREAEREERRLNQTAEWLRSIGRDDLATAVMAGGVAPGAAGGIALAPPEDDRTNARRQYDEMIALGIDPQIAMDRAYGGGSNATPVRVQSSEILEDGTTVTVMSDGTVGVVGADGERITGPAAREAIEAARQFAVDNQRDVYAARGEGRLGAEIELGGQAAQVEQLGEEAANIAVGALEARTNIMSSVGNIDDALAALDRGAESGMIYNMLPRVSEAGASLQNAMDRMGLDVVGMVTFGALSEGELRLAMQTAVPRNLDPEELRTWLERRRAAQLNAARTLEDAAIFLSTPGNTINDWLTRNRAGSQGGGEAEAPAAPVNASDDPLGLFQ